MRWEDAMAKRNVSLAMTVESVRLLDRMAAAAELSRSQTVELLVRNAAEESESMVKALAQPTVRAALSEAMLKPGVLRSLAEAMGQELSPEQTRTLFDELHAGNKPRRRKGGR